jgi:hypothetical protein
MVLFYARTEPKAAKIDADKHRAAGGGDVDWRDESLRRHGRLPEPSGDTTDIREALIAEIERNKNSPDRNYQDRLAERLREEERIRARMERL